MKGLGIGAAAVGVAIAFGSMLMKTSVHSEADYRFGTVVPAADTLNIGLLQNQQLVFQGGLALFLAGVIIFGAGTIVEALAGYRPLTDQTRGADEQLAAEMPARTSPPVDLGPNHDRNTKLFYVWSAAFIGLLLIGLFIISQTSSTGDASTAPAENSAEQLADNLEAQADNILSEANAASRR